LDYRIDFIFVGKYTMSGKCSKTVSRFHGMYVSLQACNHKNTCTYTHVWNVLTSNKKWGEEFSDEFW